MNIYSTYDELPREVRYMFNELFKDPEQAHWYATDLHSPDRLYKLADSMPGREHQVIFNGESGFCYLIIR